MLNKKNRISNRRLIQKLFDKGGLYKNAYFIFKFLPSTEDTSQFAIVVSKKVAPKAVHRNKLKRQISESIQEKLDQIKTNIVVLVIAKQGLAEIEYQDINKGIADFINKANHE